jgi:hypothetical protein
MAKPLDTRQSANRAYLRKLANIANFDSNKFNRLDHLLSAINAEVSPAFEMYPDDPSDRILNVAPNTVTNSETSIRHANSTINKQFPIFPGGTVTLPAASGSPILVSPSVTPNPTLIITANAYIKALIECDSLGNLSVTLGQEGASEALATFPGINSKAFQIGLLTIHTIAGVVQNVTGASILQFQGGGGSGSSTGTGVLEPIPGYQWLEKDILDVLATSPGSKVVATNYTNATQNLGKNLYQLSCDKSKTINTSSGTSLTVSGAPSFTVQIGDIVYLTSGARSGQWRRISAVGSQTSYTLDSSFSGGDASGGDTLMVSQAVWTTDLVNFGDPVEKTRARDQFVGNIPQIAVDYFDSLASGDNIPDFTDTARLVVSASNSGLVSDVGVPLSNTFTPPFTRQPYPQQINDYILNTSANYARLFLTFFCNPSNGSVTSSANLLGYEASFEVENFLDNGGTLDSAFCYTDDTATPINCLPAFVVSGKTRIQLSWSYVPTVNPGTTAGTLKVFVNGQEIPRFVTGSTTDAYYKEIANPISGVWNTVELHADFSASNTSVEIIRSEGIVDTSVSNTTRIANLERPTSYTMTYTGIQTTTAAPHTVHVIAVPAFTMLVPAGRYRFNIRVMYSHSIGSTGEAATFYALTSNLGSPGSGLITNDYTADGALFVGGNQVSNSDAGVSVLTEEVTLLAPTQIYFTQMRFNTSGSPTITLGIRGDLFNGGSQVEAMRIGDV